MCFSAQASFAASAALITAGAYCVHQAARKRPSYLPLALVPLAFGFQQAAEGVVWLALGRGDAELTRSAALVYLFFALAFWPFWIALQATATEAIPSRRWALAALAAANTVWFWVLFFPLAKGPETLLHTEVVHHSIEYSYPDLAVYQYVPKSFLRVVYFLSVAAPLVIASSTWGRLPGLALAGSAAAAALAFGYAFVSVWCFFAAILSAYLCVVFWSLPGARGINGGAISMSEPEA